MIQLNLFTWRPRYVRPDGPSPVKMSTPAQRFRAKLHATNTNYARGFLRRMGL